MDWRKTEIPDMVWTSGLVQQNVPVRPTGSPPVEVIDHGLSVALRIRPILILRRIKSFIAPFGKHQLFVGERLFYPAEILKLRIASRPCLVSVESGPPGVFVGLGVAQNGVGPIGDQITIMIPNDNVFVA